MNARILVAPQPGVVTEYRPARAPLDALLLYGVFGLLLFGPLAFGAVEPWAIFILEAGAAFLFSLWAVKQTISGELELRGNPLFLPMLAFALLILAQLALGLSSYRYETLSNALLYCAYGMFCFVANQSLRKSSQAKILAVVFSIYGFVVASFALLQGLAPNGKLYWVRVPRLGGWIYGPYVNHNHYAGLMEMLVPVPLVICLSHHAHRKERIMAALAAAVMASTIFLSGSRGGMVAFSVEMVILAVLLLTRQKGRKIALAIGAFLLVVVVLLTWVGGGELSKRMASIGSETRRELSGGMRLAVDRDGLRMFARRPVLGWGLGVFPDVYPQFRSFYTNFFVNEAHNDYLQLLVEMGGLGFAVMLWFLLLLYRNVLKKLGNWTTDMNGAVAVTALLGCSGILVHSFVDFNLQIPANAALFYVFCVAGASEALPVTPRRRRHREMTADMWEPSAPA